HWPCALRTTQRILPPEQRTLGNSILQSGAALGSIFTPLIVLAFLQWTPSWRPPFWVVGGLGFFWVLLWLSVVRPADLALPPRSPASGAQPPPGDSMPAPPGGHLSLADVFRDRRFWILAGVVASINCAWHFFRVWLPLFLQEIHHYDEWHANLFMSFYYLSTDAGSLSAGFAALWLARGHTVHASRM